MAWERARGTETDGLRQGAQPRARAGDPVTDGAAGTRTIGAGRRRALPAGRTVVGGFLVAVAAVIVFAASLAGASSPGQRWVVAARPLSTGTVLSADDLTSATMRLSSATAALAYRQETLVDGRRLAVGVGAGELIQDSMLVPASQVPALRPVSLAVDPVSLAGLSAGQLVDVLTTPATGSGSAVTVVVRGATLMDIATSGSNLLAPAGSGQVTIGVTTLGEVESLVAAAHSGTVTLVAAEPSDGVGPGPGRSGQ